MADEQHQSPWYHGSPQRLTVLAKGSWVTQFGEVAKAFSHKPSVMSLADDCQTVKHNGMLPGFLYVIAETVAAEDVSVLPGTAETHWQTQRDLRLELVAELSVSEPPVLTQEEVTHMKREHPEMERGSRFITQNDGQQPQAAEQGDAGDGK